MVVEKIKTLLSESIPFTELLAAIEDKSARIVQVAGAAGGAKVFIASLLFHKLKESVLYILPTEDEAERFYQDLSEINSGVNTVLFPAAGRQAWSEVGPPGTIVGKKLLALKKLLSGQPTVVVLSAQAVIEKVADKNETLSHAIKITSGGQYDFDRFVENLVNMGYTREVRADRPGEMSVRGGIVDIFLYEEPNPYRLEFFGDTIESIRIFDVETQRSIEKCERITILPLSAAGPFGPYDESPVDVLKPRNTMLDYVSGQAPIFFQDYSIVMSEMENFEKDISVRLETFIKDHDLADELTFADYYSTTQVIERKVQEHQRVDFSFLSQKNALFIDFAMQANSHFGGNLKLFKSEINDKKRSNALQAILCDSPSQTERLRNIALQEGFSRRVIIEKVNLSEGFQWPQNHLYIYTNRELFGKGRLPTPDKIETRRVSFKDFSFLKKGDYVVHTDYGIGIFRGLKPITVYGKEQECLEIEYRDGDRLYVPIDKMDRVQKYSSREGVRPIISKLGSADWQKLKARTKKRVKDIAEKLIKLYAARKLKKGYAFSKDTVWQNELEASFVYDETIDQLTAIQDIKNDMEKPTPMDRLVCGDVGFGKTEVAIRAAFKAVNDGKQVAILVPTTVLAQQHYTTFQERLSPFPVTIEMLSRFKTTHQQKEIVERLGRGEVDIIIGTHRILSKDIRFKDLGLLIIDEEHKFGVLHKERLKVLKETVDTLTLSATPIPRTMQMGLMGTRDMSVINTPPNNRMPIKTEVCRFDRELIREIILKEVERGGQVFFVHNRVQSIHAIANLLRELVPEVSFGVAHGQMRTKELEKVMMDFINNKIQCLVSTMIIESGIDMPRANTLIVNRADRFGLAQLYQLRGRVGRSSQQAYTYLIVPPLKRLKRDAIKRLQTIQEFTHLGSGYKIAMRDLEIRGAGSIFGAEQSGFVDALGFDLYTKIIREAISELRSEMNLEMAPEEKEEAPSFEPRIQLNVDAYLPDNYVRSTAERVEIYQRLIEAGSVDQVEAIYRELLDRFGPLPQPAQNLINYIEIKLLARSSLLEEIRVLNGKMVAKFHREYMPTDKDFRPWIGEIITKATAPFELKQEGNDLMMEVSLEKHKQDLAFIKKFLQSIN